MQNFFHVGTYLRGIYLSRVCFIYVVDNLVIDDDDDDDDDTCVLAVRVVEPLCLSLHLLLYTLHVTHVYFCVSFTLFCHSRIRLFLPKYFHKHLFINIVFVFIVLGMLLLDVFVT